MKTINFEGQEYTVPSWVKFIARDQDGEVWMYESRPTLCLEDGDWEWDNVGNCEQLFPNNDWTESLVNV